MGLSFDRWDPAETSLGTKHFAIMERFGKFACLATCLLVAVSASSSSGASSLNTLDLTFVLQKLETDFTLAVRIAGLIATSAETELLLNHTEVLWITKALPWAVL